MICPYLSGIDLEGKLVKVDCLQHECAKYVQLMGQNPNTGEQISKWDCADALVPVLLIENTHTSRQTGAAVESFRNEVVKTGEHMAKALVMAGGKSLWLESK